MISGRPVVDRNGALLRGALTVLGLISFVAGLVLCIKGIWSPVQDKRGDLAADPRYVNTGLIFVFLGATLGLGRWVLWMSDGGRW